MRETQVSTLTYDIEKLYTRKFIPEARTPLSAKLSMPPIAANYRIGGSFRINLSRLSASEEASSLVQVFIRLCQFID